MSKQSITATYDSLPFIARLLIQIFAGWIASGIYRIVKFFETKNTMTLIIGLLATFTGLGNAIMWFVDLFTLITSGKITLFAD